MRKNWPYGAYYFMFWLSIGCLSPYLGIFYQQRGLNGTQIGLLNAIACLATIPASLLIGPLADKSRSPRSILFGLIAGIFIVFGSLYALHGFWLFAIATLIYGFVSNPTSDMADTLLMAQLKEKPHTYGNYRLGGSAGYMLGVTAAGLLMGRLGMPSLFISACSMLLVTLLVVRALPVVQAPEKPKGEKRASLYTLSKSSAFAPAFLTLVIWGLTDSGTMFFLSLHVVENGLPAAYTSTLISAAMVGEIAFFFFAPIVLKRLGPLRAMALAFLLQAIRMAALFYIQHLPAGLQFAAQILGGGAFATVYAGDTEFIRRGFSDNVAYTAQSLKAIANRGVGTSLGSLVFGRMLDVVSTNAAFLCMGAVALLYIGALLFMQRKQSPGHAAQLR